MAYNAAAVQPVVTAPMDYGKVATTVANVQNANTRNMAMQAQLEEMKRQTQVQTLLGSGRIDEARRLAPSTVAEYERGQMQNQAMGHQLQQHDMGVAYNIADSFLRAERKNPGAGYQVLDFPANRAAMERLGFLQPGQNVADIPMEELMAEAVKIKAASKPYMQDPDLPAAVKVAQYLRENPEDEEWIYGAMAAMSPKTNINTTTVQEGAYAKEEGTNLATMRQEIRSKASAARKSLQNLDRFEFLNEFVETGPGATTIAQIKGLASTLGIDLGALGIEDNTAPAQAMQALNTKFALDNTSETKGPISDAEMRLFLQASPALINAPGGNALIISMMRKAAERSIEVDRMAAEYASGNRGQLDDGFSVVLDEYHRKNPFFTDAEEAKIRMALDVSSGKAPDRGFGELPGIDKLSPEVARELENRWNEASPQQRTAIQLRLMELSE